MNLTFLSRLLLLSALAVLLPACQTGSNSSALSQFPTPDAHWKSSVGQLQYSSKERSVIGEAVVSRNGTRDFQLDFTAGPGVPLMRLRISGANARAEGMFARGSWQGDPARAHGPVGSWMPLREVFATFDATHEKREHAQPPTGEWAAHAEWSKRHLKRLAVDYPRTGERFVFVFGE